MERFIHFRSDKFPILPGETDELVNEGMYGKALALYLQEKLAERGYDTGFVGCEDWGWWVDASKPGFASGVRIYSEPCDEGANPAEFCVTHGSGSSRKWNWKAFRFDDLTPLIRQLDADLLAIVEADRDIELIGVVDEFPLSESDDEQ